MLHDANRRTKNVQDGCRATAAWLGTRVAVAWKVPERASERARHQRLGVVPKRGQRNKLARNYGNTFSCCRPNSLRAIETNKTGLVGGWWLLLPSWPFQNLSHRRDAVVSTLHTISIGEYVPLRLMVGYDRYAGGR